jgi:hypothetical protein
MARSLITTTSANDLQSDSGSVLFSFVQGEQLEFPVTLSFLENASLNYTYECVLMEALNVLDQTDPPIKARPGGVNTVLTVFVPPWKNAWAAATSYNRDDLVSYGGLYYILTSGTSRVSATLPTIDTTWQAYVPNVVYIRFPESLSTTASGWDPIAVPTTESNVYGHIELRVTEPNGGRYPRTWKPLRGVVEFSYSPTQLVV